MENLYPDPACKRLKELTRQFKEVIMKDKEMRACCQRISRELRVSEKDLSLDAHPSIDGVFGYFGKAQLIKICH